MPNEAENGPDEEGDVGPVEDDIRRITLEEDCEQESAGSGELNTSVSSLESDGTSAFSLQRPPAPPLPGKTKSPRSSKRGQRPPTKEKPPDISKSGAPQTMSAQPGKKILIDIPSEAGDKEARCNVERDVDGELVIISAPISVACWLLRMMSSKSENSSIMREQSQPRKRLSVDVRYETDDKKRGCRFNCEVSGVPVVARGPLSLLGWLMRILRAINGLETG